MNMWKKLGQQKWDLYEYVEKIRRGLPAVVKIQHLLYLRD